MDVARDCHAVERAEEEYIVRSHAHARLTRGASAPLWVRLAAIDATPLQPADCTSQTPAVVTRLAQPPSEAAPPSSTAQQPRSSSPRADPRVGLAGTALHGGSRLATPSGGLRPLVRVASAARRPQMPFMTPYTASIKPPQRWPLRGEHGGPPSRGRELGASVSAPVLRDSHSAVGGRRVPPRLPPRATTPAAVPRHACDSSPAPKPGKRTARSAPPNRSPCSPRRPRACPHRPAPLVAPPEPPRRRLVRPRHHRNSPTSLLQPPPRRRLVP